jgi:DNA-binding NarL/FixJ family response regulator
MQAIDPQVRAIVSSGYSDDPVISDYAACGFCGRIAKPFRVQQLHETIIMALRSGPKKPAALR